MPDVATHHAFALEVRSRLPREIRDCLIEEPYLFAQYGPDPWFVYQPWKRREGRGRHMHTTRTGQFLNALAEKARDGSAPREMFSYLAGFLCHYALDSITHPYIIWQSTETWPSKRAHRDLEHALDIALLKREGRWESSHPVTEAHFPRLRLPKAMAEDLEDVYLRVYGWARVHPALNRCYVLYRSLYRIMEQRRSLPVLLATLCPTPGLLSIPYRKCAFVDRDVENLSHQPWHQPYAREMTSTESFPELQEKAREEALRMIGDAFSFVFRRAISGEELARSLGNRSYLSGLDVEDPRNLEVRSLRPPQHR